MTGCKHAIAIAIVVVLGVSAERAHAQPTAAAAAATAEFDKGRDFLKKGKFAEACAAFAQSQKLDPAFGTLYNLAGCYVKIGKLTSAWLAYRELAQKDTKESRKKDSAKQAADLEPRLPKLLVTAAAAPAGLVVTMNGEDITPLVGVVSPVNLGKYKIVAKAPTYATFETIADVSKEGETTTIALALAHPMPVQPVKPTPPPIVATKAEPEAGEPEEPEPETPTPTSHRKMYAVITAGAGVALIATGLVFGNAASGKWSDVKAVCGDDLACDNSQYDQGKALSNQAHTDATLSTVFVVGGAIAVGIGGFLWFTAPSHPDRTALRLAPSADATTVGLSLQGGF